MKPQETKYFLVSYTSLGLNLILPVNLVPKETVKCSSKLLKWSLYYK